jgi:hypothetical protein
MDDLIGTLYVLSLILWFPLLIVFVLYCMSRIVHLSRKHTVLFIVIGFVLTTIADYFIRDYHSWAVFIGFLCCYKGVIL